MKLPLCYYGHPILRKQSTVVSQITDEIRQLVSDMIETCDQSNGIGLAAVQVGHPLRLFVLRRYLHEVGGEWRVSEPYVYINPHILSHSHETAVSEEGCLSIPKLHLPVRRPVKIRVESTKLDGSVAIEEVEGINGRVILHENDHLNGTLFIDRVDQEHRKGISAKLREIKKTYHDASL